jgi:hypothetical protein
MGSVLAPFPKEGFDTGQITVPLIPFPVPLVVLLQSSYYLPHRQTSCRHAHIPLPVLVWKFHRPLTLVPRDETIPRREKLHTNCRLGIVVPMCNPYTEEAMRIASMPAWVTETNPFPQTDQI